MPGSRSCAPRDLAALLQALPAIAQRLALLAQQMRGDDGAFPGEVLLDPFDIARGERAGPGGFGPARAGPAFKDAATFQQVIIPLADKRRFGGAFLLSRTA